MKNNQVIKINLVCAIVMAIFLVLIIVIHINKNNDENVSIKEEFEWNGTYINDEYIIRISKISEENVEIIIDKKDKNGDSEESYGIDMNLKSNTQIEFKNELFGESEEFNIQKTQKGIKVKAESTYEDSILNECSGEYLKEEFEELGWDGIYKKGDITIVLSEIASDCICMTAEKNFSVERKYCDNYNRNQITYEGYPFGNNKEDIVITKIEKGIKISARSEYKESLINELSGEYDKQ